MRHMLFGATAAFAVLAMGGAALADYSITILHTNDLHSRIEQINKFDSTCSADENQKGECFGGVARVKAKIDERRKALAAEGKNVIVLDAGDQFQGSLFYTTYKGKDTAEFMNMIGYDAMAVGNHEFDDGPQGLADFIGQVRFPVISGNTDVTGEPLLNGKLPGAVVLEVGGEKIAVVATLAEDTGETSSPGKGVRFIASEDYLKGAVDAFELAGITKIIALTHVGLPRDMEIAARVAGIDAIVGGHSHTLLSNTNDKAAGPYPTLVKNPAGQDVPIVQAYAYSKYLGEIELTFDDAGTLVSAKGEPILLDKSVEPDAAVAARVAELAKPLEELRAKVIGSAAAAIDGSRDTCRSTECQMGNLITDAMLDRVKGQGVQIAIQNGGGARASIDAGEVTMGEVLTVLPFQNTLATFQVKGSDIVAALENGVSKVEEAAGRFPQVSGLRFKWTRAKPAGEGRIITVEVMENGAWTPIDPDKVYGVATNNYMRAGGDGYGVFAKAGMNAYDFGPGLDQVVADFIAASKDYTPYTDGRITEVK
ncbi:multifunctional 2',3'-cyclic-nucleotide 2'-phosphodiesterase/5'-nucleotidase/3'-nucleotidase [Microvirga tunisiensis]|uniref:Multifunctional 2',3'-cyclic-nucleotide 2'-phosphodiesterase/5'-nucleotidase/3'-nucleotidase n=1 Tax=Pannonibacter tanglangensis TaxID=2750084 RepID=A0A7X5F2N3_9HYPH|nr:bifunctional metallophosphatase/5'-nucleotidase [Pannonibacter sp. XCT-53]NBN78648.1 multifunctional 2',3'-cyclic-nucleotide 2'-phosphodiesterase/5'-nucleotidase/3'-nucleotidase [Pannonibacter sp. XCT-53]